MSKNTEQFIHDTISVSWRVAHELGGPGRWTEIMSECVGAQAALIALDLDHPACEELHTLWAVAMHRRSMEYELNTGIQE